MQTKAQVRQYISNLKKVAVFNTHGDRVIEVAFPKRTKFKWENDTYELARSHLDAFKIIERQEKTIQDFHKLITQVNDKTIPFEEKVELLRGLLNVG